MSGIGGSPSTNLWYRCWMELGDCLAEKWRVEGSPSSRSVLEKMDEIERRQAEVQREREANGL